MSLLRKTPLQIKILAIVMLLVAVAVVVSSYLSFRFSNQAAIAVGATLIRNELTFRSTAVDFVHEQAQGEIVLAAHLPAFEEYFSLPESRAGNQFRDGVLQFSPAQRALKREIDDWVRYFQSKFYTEETCLIDRRGQEHSRLVRGEIAPDRELSPEEGSQPFFHASLALKDGEVHIQYPYVSADTDYWVFAYTTPITLADGSIPAFYHMELPISRFQEAAIQTRYGQAFALDLEKGLILADSANPIAILRKPKQDAETTAEPKTDDHQHKHSHGGEADAPRLEDYFPPITKIGPPAVIKNALKESYYEFEENGVEYVLLARTLKQFDWVLVTKIEREALLALGQQSDASQYVNNIGWIAGAAVGVLAIALLFSIVLSRAITRPLAALVAATRRIGQGEMDTPVPVIGNDEISQVATEAEQMRSRLKTLIEQIRSSAQEEADEILLNTNEGIFLLHPGPGGVIGRRHSRELENIFASSDFAGRRLSELISGRVPDTLLADVDAYVDLLFRADLEIDMLDTLNLLNPVELRFEDGRVKTVRMIFARVTDANSITRIFVTTRDITEDARMASELEERERSTRRELDLVQDIFAAGPDVLGTFIESAELELEQVGNLLRTANDSPTREMLHAIFRSIHTIKGNAALFGLKIAAGVAHRYEDAIQELQRSAGESIPASGFLGIATRHAELDGVIREIRTVLKKIRDFDRSGGADNGLDAIDIIRLNLPRIAAESARNAGNAVRIEFHNFTSSVIPREFAPVLTDVLVQLVRNSIAHGIEDAAIRQAASKAPDGLIQVEAKSGESELRIVYRDDGAGLNRARIADRLIQSGTLAESAIATLGDVELLDFIFSSGFSTKTATADSDADHNAGRGFGLDIVQKRISAIGGSVSVESRSGKYTIFRIVLPLT